MIKLFLTFILINIGCLSSQEPPDSLYVKPTKYIDCNNFKIIKKAKELLNRDIYLVFGGFHLMQHSEEQVDAIIKAFKELGVQKCGATHCTGDRAIQQFKDAYGDDYVEIGSGRVLHFGKPTSPR